MRKPQIASSEGFWLLRKGLYRLKQAGRSWYLEFNTKMESISFKQCKSDWSIHYRDTPEGQMITTTSVDNIVIASSSQEESDRVVEQLSRIFNITDNNNVSWLLGCQVIHDWKAGTIMLN